MSIYNYCTQRRMGIKLKIPPTIYFRSKYLSFTVSAWLWPLGRERSWGPSVFFGVLEHFAWRVPGLLSGKDPVNYLSVYLTVRNFSLQVSCGTF